MTVSAHDVAAFILQKTGSITTWKLQKLLYYSQAWSLVWDDAPLFGERIEAWANGPVVPDIYECHKGHYRVRVWSRGDSCKLSQKSKDTVLAVLKYYGDKDGQWLSELTHKEAPWKDAREGIPPSERGNKRISIASMAEYYSGLLK